MTIEQLLEEKRTFDLSRDFEKLGVEDEEGKAWRDDGTFGITFEISRAY